MMAVQLEAARLASNYFPSRAKDAKDEFTTMATASRVATRKDATAMKTGVVKFQQTLKQTKDKIMMDIKSVSPSIPHVEGLRKAIQNESHKGVDAVRAEKVRNMEILNDKSRSIKDEFQKLTTTTEDSILTTIKDATDMMDAVDAEVCGAQQLHATYPQL